MGSVRGSVREELCVKHYGEWLLGERLAAAALDLYARQFGSLEPLLRSLNSPLTQKFLASGGLRGMPLVELARLTGRAVIHFAAEDNRRSGRSPLRAADWRVIRYGISSARTLRESVLHCVDCFEAIDWRCGRMSLRTRGEVAELHLDAMRPAPSPMGGVLDLYGVASIHNLFSWIINRTIPITGIGLDHPPQEFAALQLPELPFPLALDRGWTGFQFPTAFLDYPVVRPVDQFDNPPPGSFLFDGQGLDIGEEAAVTQVRRLALKQLRQASRLPSFDQIVAAMGGSSATLRRRLAREGTNYREVKDSCRREVALDLLRDSSLSIEDIACRLDYCDSDAFRRAFREWLGVAPSMYRKAAMSGEASGLKE